MWSNIGKVEENKGNMGFLPTPRNSVDLSNKPVNDALFIYADCHSAMKGLFFGEGTSPLPAPHELPITNSAKSSQSH